MAARDSFLNSFESLAVASEWTPMEEARPINVPIYSSSTFKLPTIARGEQLSTGKVSETTVHSCYAKKKSFCFTYSGVPVSFGFLFLAGARCSCDTCSYGVGMVSCKMKQNLTQK